MLPHWLLLTPWTVIALASTCFTATHGAVVVNTWPFTEATQVAYETLTNSTTSTAVDAVVAGCHQCEVDQCDGTVGFGGSPDSTGETTLDAMVLDGSTHAMGAVAGLRRIKAAVHVARAVMDHSAHSLLAGEGATAFARMLGFPEQSLQTSHSKHIFDEWHAHQCQPNYYRHVVNQTSACPPYEPEQLRVDDFEMTRRDMAIAQALITRMNHDTIGMVALSQQGHMAAGTSSNGASHKIAGRIGDAAVVGAGAYVDSNIGGAACTGDGDIMMRFLPSFHAVMDMGQGTQPEIACQNALLRIAAHFPAFKGGMVCLNRLGEVGAAGHGWKFAYSFQRDGMMKPTVVQVDPVSLE